MGRASGRICSKPAGRPSDGVTARKSWRRCPRNDDRARGRYSAIPLTSKARRRCIISASPKHTSAARSLRPLFAPSDPRCECSTCRAMRTRRWVSPGLARHRLRAPPRAVHQATAPPERAPLSRFRIARPTEGRAFPRLTRWPPPHNVPLPNDRTGRHAMIRVSVMYPSARAAAVGWHGSREDRGRPRRRGRRAGSAGAVTRPSVTSSSSRSTSSRRRRWLIARSSSATSRTSRTSRRKSRSAR